MLTLGPQHVLQSEIGMSAGKKFPQNDRNNAKTENLQVYHIFSQFCLYSYSCPAQKGFKGSAKTNPGIQ